MTVYNYENVTYHFTGGSVINCKDWQEGVLVYLETVGEKNKKKITIYLEKENATQLAKLIQEGRKFWTPFRLPKMVKQ